ncbi:MAG: L-rhamnose/proton symporter RhaT [Bryobacteraceae bacterium]
MQESASWTAALTVVAGGILHGSFALPMKKLSTWKWENTWLIYSISGLVVLPLLLALVTVPPFFEAVSSTSAATLALIVLCGVGWGAGSTLFGLAIDRVGMALTFAIVLGITSSLGSLLPLLIQNPAELFSRRGQILLAGLALVVAGILLCSKAGALRERAQNPEAASSQKRSGAFTGLLICIASGVLSPALNFGFVFGEPLRQEAIRLGASEDFAGNALWALALGGGFFVNAGYAVYLLGKNRTWGVYSNPEARGWYWAGAALMGLLWYMGISIYGMGAAAMGPLGGVLGWPIFMSTVIIMANVWGAATGEWKGAGPQATRLMWTGVAVLVAAIAVIAQAN